MNQTQAVLNRVPAAAVRRPRRPPQHRRRQRREVVWLLRILLAGVLLTVWQLISGHLVDKFWISSPRDIWHSLVTLQSNGQLLPFIGVTTEEMAIGLVFGVAAGVLAGVLLGLYEPLANVLQPYIQAIYSIPKIAIAPLFILWFGIELKSKVILIVVVVFFLLFWNTYDGVRDVEQELVDVVRLMGAGKWYVITRVVLPSALGSVFTGIKTAIPQALVAAVVGEMVAANRGVGYFIQFSSSQFDTAGVFAGLLILMVLAIIIDFLAGRIQSLLMRWNRP